MTKNTDLILFNGKFHTLNPAQPRATTLAIRDGKIIYVGEDAELRHSCKKAIDLRGCCVVPGLTDAHLHFQWFAQNLQAVNAETPTLDEALNRVAEHAARKAAGEWITGYGWNHNVWGGAFPTAAQLDRVAPVHPVALQAKSGHALWANSRVLELAGITAETPDPPGAQIVRDVNGAATGILLEEEAMNLVLNIIPKPTIEDLAEMFRAALPVAHRAGLTGIHDFDRPPTFSVYQMLDLREELTLRVNKLLHLEQLDEAITIGLRTGFGSDRLRVGQVKIFADGALGPRTALMLNGYDSAPYEFGIATHDTETIRGAVEKAIAAGLACAIHAIGDRANREVLDVYEDVLGRQPRGAKLRHRIEHVQLLHPTDYGRLAKLGIIASMQPLHATSDIDIANEHWGARCAGAYAWRTLQERGTVLAFGSDCPVETLDPLKGIHAAVTRRRADGYPGADGWYPEQRLTVAEAVRGFTWGAAYAAGMEDKLGSLEVGKLADLTILDRDIFEIDPMDILHTRVMGTVVGGEFVWRDVGM